jgi:SAM-dependent methyltransferase
MKSKVKKKKELKLHLGCGEKYLEGYVNIDYPPEEHTVMAAKADVYQDIRTLEYDEGTVEEVRSHHLFEHFNRVEALKLLIKWRMWLKPGGRLVIETPDFEASARAYLWAITRRRKMMLGRHIFGSHEAGWAYHYDFWDKGKFKFVLKKVGFKNIKAERYSNSLAKHYPHVPLLNIIGNLLPDVIYRKYGGNKLPDIIVRAEKDSLAPLDEDVVIRELLSEYLTPHDNYRMLNAWLSDSSKPDEEK